LDVVEDPVCILERSYKKINIAYILEGKRKNMRERGVLGEEGKHEECEGRDGRGREGECTYWDCFAPN
jgi:hypothetical protein